MATLINLPQKLYKKLQRWARSSNVPYCLVIRARIAVLAHEGHVNTEIARQVGCDAKTVDKWRDRIAVLPDVLALEDEYRTGRPARIPMAAHHELIQLACMRPGDDKARFEQVWTLDI